MRNDQSRLRHRTSHTTVVVLGAAMMVGCLGAFEGCGGSTTSVTLADGGEDGMTSMPDGSIRKDTGTKDTGTTAKDTGATTKDTGTARDTGTTGTDSGMDSTATVDSGTDSAVGHDGGADSGKGDTGTGPACTGSETKCNSATVTAGLCVAGSCADCKTGTDNASCTAAYGVSSVCNAAGACVPGDCNLDSDCTGANAGYLCTANTCTKCTTDTSCHNDPGYGAGFLCDTAGACVSNACSSTAKTCGNAADFCCGTPATADCTATGMCACIAGDCCTSADCASAAAPVCGGGGTKNICGKCTADSQCPAGDVCITAAGATQGTCEAKAASLCGVACTAPNTPVGCTPPGTGTGGGKPGVCAPNATDMCCNSTATSAVLEICIAAPATGTACCPGTAGNTFCDQALMAGAVCDATALVCTACGAISANTYFVDPLNGSDQTGNGSVVSSGAPPASEPGCALRTITRALQIIGSPTVPTTIVIVGGAVGVGETFPLVIPANVTITNKATTTITVPAPKAGGTSNGFTLSSPTSSINGSAVAGATLVITTVQVVAGGVETGGSVAILVNGNAGGNGTAAQATSISNVTITGMLNHGVEIDAGIVNINGGVISTANGFAGPGAPAVAGDGLFVSGGQAIISVAAGGTPTTFNSNTAHGILVQNGGSITLTGSVTTPLTGVGTIETNNNSLAGVWIQQASPVTGNPPLNTITGLASFGSEGNGMRIVTPSTVTVRSSAFLGNNGSGVIISAGGATGNNSFAGIDLGDTTTKGLNTFQAAAAPATNRNAGICIDVNNQSNPLLAIGNQFSALNCATQMGTLSVNPHSCDNAAAPVCTGGICDIGLIDPVVAGASTNSATVTGCTF